MATLYQPATIAAAALLPPLGAAVVAVVGPLSSMLWPWTPARVIVNAGRSITATLAACWLWQASGGSSALAAGTNLSLQVTAGCAALLLFTALETVVHAAVICFTTEATLRQLRELRPEAIVESAGQNAIGLLSALLVVHSAPLLLILLPIVWLACQSVRFHLVQALSDTDAKTELCNARAWRRAAEDELARAARRGRPIAVAMVDLDHFRAVNTECGHLGGDEILATVAERMQRSVRSHDVVGRFGGEEFAILLPGTTLPEAQQILERVRLAVTATPVRLPDSREFRVTLSGGVTCQTGATDLDQLVQHADAALYEAKQRGRNQIRTSVGVDPHRMPSQQRRPVEKAL